MELMEGSSANVFPHPLARKAWGRCPAASMRETYYAFAASSAATMSQIYFVGA